MNEKGASISAAALFAFSFARLGETQRRGKKAPNVGLFAFRSPIRSLRDLLTSQQVMEVAERPRAEFPGGPRTEIDVDGKRGIFSLFLPIGRLFSFLVVSPFRSTVETDARACDVSERRQWPTKQINRSSFLVKRTVELEEAGAALDVRDGDGRLLAAKGLDALFLF